MTRRVLGRDILRCVSALSGLSVKQLTSGRRLDGYIGPRHLAIYLMRQHCPWLSLSGIGVIMGMVNHTSITHVMRTFPDRVSKNPDLADLHDRVSLALNLAENPNDKPALKVVK